MNGESWLMNPATRDYEQQGGKPVVTRSLKMPMYFRTLVGRRKWLYAPDDSYGSDFASFRGKQNEAGAVTAQAIERRALQPLIADGRALEIDVTVTPERNGLVINARALEANGTETELNGLRPIRT